MLLNYDLFTTWVSYISDQMSQAQGLRPLKGSSKKIICGTTTKLLTGYLMYNGFYTTFLIYRVSKI